MKPNLQFDPGTVVALEAQGTVYPSGRLVDEWGTLSVTSDLLLDQNWKTATVAGPVEGAENTLRGNGWTLNLSVGWSLAKGTRRLDSTVVREAR